MSILLERGADFPETGGGGRGDGRILSADGPFGEPVTKDLLKPVVLAWLTNDAGLYGFLTCMPIIRNWIPAVEARRMLADKDDWTGPLSLLFIDRDHVFSNMRRELAKLPDGYTASSKYQKELENSSGPKFVRFYGALWHLMTGVMDEAELQTVSSVVESSGVLSYADRAYIAAQYKPIAKYLTIPENPREQLKLVKELGPQIYPNWHLDN